MEGSLNRLLQLAKREAEQRAEDRALKTRCSASRSASRSMQSVIRPTCRDVRGDEFKPCSLLGASPGNLFKDRANAEALMHRLLSTTTTCLPADQSDNQNSTTTRPRRPVRESPPRGYRCVWFATVRSGTQGKDSGKLVEDRAGWTSRKARDISPGRHPRARSSLASNSLLLRT